MKIEQKIKETETRMTRLQGLIASRSALMAKHLIGLSPHDDRRQRGDLASLEDLFEQEKLKLENLYTLLETEKAEKKPDNLLQKIKRSVVL